METIDIWVNCFFGSVDHSNRRLCQYDGHYGTAECDRECPFYLTKRDAIDIVKEYMYMANDIKAVNKLREECEIAMKNFDGNGKGPKCHVTMMKEA